MSARRLGLSPRRRIFGIDFSAAADAGRKIWLAEGRSDGLRLVIEDCWPAADLLGSDQRREECLPALVEFIGAQRDAAFGCDFPFGLPAHLVDAGSWSDFVLAFPERHATPEDFQNWCVAATRCRTGGARKETRRKTDQESRTPWAAWNLKLYKQTYYGIRDLLFPLVRDRRASICPMQIADNNRPWLLETCPASTLKYLGQTLALGSDLHRHYKGGRPEHCKNRRRILSVLIDSHCLAPLRDDIRSKVLKNAGGDALDSIVAAVAAHRAVANGLGPPGDAVEALEGKVYFRVCSETKGAHAR